MTKSGLKIGFIGLGVMGTPMAGHLLAAGHILYVHTVGKVPEALAEGGATVCVNARGVAERAAESGEFASDAPARFPQLIVAPLLVAVLWDGMFSKLNPLDVGGLLRAHRELLCGKPKGSMS